MRKKKKKPNFFDFEILANFHIKEDKMPTIFKYSRSNQNK